MASFECTSRDPGKQRHEVELMDLDRVRDLNSNQITSSWIRLIDWFRDADGVGQIYGTVRKIQYSLQACSPSLRHKSTPTLSDHNPSEAGLASSHRVRFESSRPSPKIIEQPNL